MAKIDFKTLAGSAAIAAAGVMGAASAASAATIGIWNDSPTGTTQRANVDCTGCSVLLFSADGSDTGTNVVAGTMGAIYGFGTGYGELFSGPSNSGGASEISWMNGVLGTTYVTGDAVKTENTTDGTEYTSSAAYAIVKIGTDPNYTILRNDSGGVFSFSWNGLSGQGAGISHFTAVGDASDNATVVPLPAAGVLMLGALGALTALRRRKTA